MLLNMPFSRQVTSKYHATKDFFFNFFQIISSLKLSRAKYVGTTLIQLVKQYSLSSLNLSCQQGHGSMLLDHTVCRPERSAFSSTQRKASFQLEKVFLFLYFIIAQYIYYAIVVSK